MFRFNRRRWTSRGLVSYRVLRLIVAHDLVRHREPQDHPGRPVLAATRPASTAHPPTDRDP